MTDAMVATPAPQLPFDERTRRVVLALMGLREIRTVKELAEKARLPYNTLREHLNGKNGGIQLDELEPLANALGITPTELVQIAETGQGFPLRAHRTLQLINGGAQDRTPPRRPLVRLVD